MSNSLSAVHPELVAEWSEKNDIKPTEVSVGSHKKGIWQCKQGHEWTATVKSRTINGTGCPYCSHNKVLAGFNDLATVFSDVAAEWSDRNEKKPTEVTAFANSKAWWTESGVQKTYGFAKYLHDSLPNATYVELRLMEQSKSLVVL